MGYASEYVGKEGGVFASTAVRHAFLAVTTWAQFLFVYAILA